MCVEMNRLKEKTDNFFKLHWPSKFGKAPAWSDIYTLIGEIPNGEKQGVYVLLSKKKVKYIGSGISRGSGINRGCGIGARVSNYIRWKRGDYPGGLKNRRYEFKDELKDRKYDQIITLGFKPEHSYLASALELFLIREEREEKDFPSLINTNKPGS